MATTLTTFTLTSSNPHAPSSLSLCYPSCYVQSPYLISQPFQPHLTISSSTSSQCHHVISSFSDLTVTLDFPSSNLTFFLVRGCPYVTLSISHHTTFSITTLYKFSSFTSNSSLTRYQLMLENDQSWLIYASLPIKFTYTNDIIAFSKANTSDDDGDEVPLIVRIAALPDSSSEIEDVLDRHNTCYPVSGYAVFTKPYCVEYKWQKRGFGDLLMLAHPLHLQLLSKHESNNVTVLEDFKYRSIDGDLVGVVGDSWLLKADHVPITWHSIRGVKEESFDEIKSALSKDVAGLCFSETITISFSTYGKSIARAARLALIAEEVGFLEVIPAIKKFLQETIQPLLDGAFDGFSFLDDAKLGGIIYNTCSSEDDRFETFSTHHYEFGYFLYGIAVLAKIDPSWGKKYKPHAYSFIADFMNLGAEHRLSSTSLSCFDLYRLHSWSGEIFKVQDSASESVNAYYSAALMGLAYGDMNLAAIGPTLASLEIHAAKMHVKEGDNMYSEEFAKANKLVGYISASGRRNHTMRHYDVKDCKVALHVLLLLPISECLFSNVVFVKELVEWTHSRYGGGDRWKGFVYALEGIYDNQTALKKIRRLKGFLIVVTH
ncbi:hypothetical protein PIB30_001501 [Stylosanthes scabra]|uniref:glucan endo-1,3-beta-D-glucosidase n=1 Tax=Stylosanthes scabra TaxID=79078 RepID=A0ABU6Q3L2_9FABA|nr:hypothetical protein [Stylosanthes scabra]